MPRNLAKSARAHRIIEKAAPHAVAETFAIPPVPDLQAAATNVAAVADGGLIT
jgi:hypothetical protein